MRYEAALEELQNIVKDLQDEKIGIDELAEKIARAAELIQLCREKLRDVETRIDGLFPPGEE
jgi:exodeoxyribonuclease VII small subunit